jgi:hypothetical protein
MVQSDNGTLTSEHVTAARNISNINCKFLHSGPLTFTFYYMTYYEVAQSEMFQSTDALPP